MRPLAKFRAILVGMLLVMCVVFTGALLLSASAAGAGAQQSNDVGLHVTSDGDGLTVTNDGERTIRLVVESDGDYAGEGTYRLSPGETIRLPMPAEPMTVTATATADDWRLEATIEFTVREACGDEYVVPSHASYEFTAERGDRTETWSREHDFPRPAISCEYDRTPTTRDHASPGAEDHDRRAPNRSQQEPDDRAWDAYERGSAAVWSAYGAGHDNATAAYAAADRRVDEAYAEGHERFWRRYEQGRERAWSTYERVNETLQGDDNESDDGSPVDDLQDRANATINDTRDGANRVVNDGQDGANRVINDGQDLANRTVADTRDRANRVIDDGQDGAERIRNDLENDSERLPGGGEPPGVPPELPVEPPERPEQPECEDAPAAVENRVCDDGGEPPEPPADAPDADDVTTDADADADARSEGTDARAGAHASGSAQVGEYGVTVERGLAFSTGGAVGLAGPTEAPPSDRGT